MITLSSGLAIRRIVYLFPLLWIAFGCAVQETSKFKLANGYYKSMAFKNQSKKVYIDNSEDTVFVYTMNKATGLPDTIFGKHSFPQVSSNSQIAPAFFRQGSFDIDFITIPFKFRPVQADLPRQLNANLNGAVYLGYRNDIYQLAFNRSPVRKYQRITQHYGMSYGLFTGLGGTAMNQWVTNNMVSSEYDGVVWTKGIAGIVGVNNFTIGLALGFDNLLDQNKKFWIYQKKPWLGLAFGLNLN